MVSRGELDGVRWSCEELREFRGGSAGVGGM